MLEAVFVLGTWLAGCVHAPMHRTERGLATPPPGRALVVFIRQGSPKDSVARMPVAVADARGGFVARLDLNERVAVPVWPGRAIFVAFRGVGSRFKAFYEEEPSPIPALLVEAIAGKVYYVAVNLISLPDGKDWAAAGVPIPPAPARGTDAWYFGVFGGTHMVPLGPRFGTDPAELRDMLRYTSSYEIDEDEAHAYEQEVREQYWWDYSWRRGLNNARRYDAEKRERQTMHETDAR
jgi:hypothetical protein